MRSLLTRLTNRRHDGIAGVVSFLWVAIAGIAAIFAAYRASVDSGGSVVLAHTVAWLLCFIAGWSSGVWPFEGRRVRGLPVLLLVVVVSFVSAWAVDQFQLAAGRSEGLAHAQFALPFGWLFVGGSAFSWARWRTDEYSVREREQRRTGWTRLHEEDGPITVVLRPLLRFHLLACSAALILALTWVSNVWFIGAAIGLTAVEVWLIRARIVVQRDRLMRRDFIEWGPPVMLNELTDIRWGSDSRPTLTLRDRAGRIASMGTSLWADVEEVKDIALRRSPSAPLV